jgi:hypothetical protein
MMSGSRQGLGRWSVSKVWKDLEGFQLGVGNVLDGSRRAWQEGHEARGVQRYLSHWPEIRSWDGHVLYAPGRRYALRLYL